MTEITKNKVMRCWKLEILSILAPVNSAPGFPLLTSCKRFFGPIGGMAGTLNLNRSLLYSRANTLALPDEGEILLNRRKGLFRFATRYEPKPILYGNFNQCKRSGKSISLKGGRGVDLLFPTYLPTVS